MVVKDDEYVNKVYVGGGRHPPINELVDTDYAILVKRTLVNSSDLHDIAAVNALQDQYEICANSATPFAVPNHNRDSSTEVLNPGLDVGRDIPDPRAPRRMSTAFGWGGRPEHQKTVRESISCGASHVATNRATTSFADTSPISPCVGSIDRLD
ncbi:MAG: hypothetical protein AAFU80_23760 [Pseudomonadota bacterium]